MADDAAAPEGELNESTVVDSSGDSAGATESPKTTDAGTEVPEATEAADPTDESETAAPTTAEADPARLRLLTIVGLVAVLVLAGVAGWFGYRAFDAYQTDQKRALFLEVGRQAAINLTTIDYQHADADVQRILDSATDTFYDDFAKRSQPFVDVVKQAQSKSTGEVTAAGVESMDPGGAQVLAAVTVKTSNAGAPEQPPRAWRMRVTVKQIGKNEAKVSNVEFVP
jgi:Mce-associated membrane protein